MIICKNVKFIKWQCLWPIWSIASSRLKNCSDNDHFPRINRPCPVNRFFQKCCKGFKMAIFHCGYYTTSVKRPFSQWLKLPWERNCHNCSSGPAVRMIDWHFNAILTMVPTTAMRMNRCENSYGTCINGSFEQTWEFFSRQLITAVKT